MYPVSVDQLATLLGAAPPREGAERRVHSVSTDTRRLAPGSVFFAIQGERFDGSAFLEQAATAGAEAAVAPLDAPSVPGFPVLRVPDPCQALLTLAHSQRQRLGYTVVAITGSAGKTTTKDLLYHMLRGQRRTVRARKSFNNHIGVPLTLLEATAETEVVVLEVGTSGPGEIDRLGRVAQPDLGVITCIAPAHLEGLGSVAGVAREKLSLLAHVKREGGVVLNAGDMRLLGAASALRSVRGHASVTLCGWGEGDVRGELAPATPTALTVREGGREVVQLPLSVPGRHFALDALLAYAAARRLGITPAQAAAGLADFQPPSGRLNVHPIGQVTLIDDTYNANPVSVNASLETFCELAPAEKRVVVLGPMKELGSASEAMHQAVGRTVARMGVGALIVVGAEGEDIAQGAREGGLSEARIYPVADAAAAAQRVLELIRPGDAALFKASRAARLEEAVAEVQSALAERTTVVRRAA